MTETVRIDGFRAGDSESIVELWNRCLPEDPISPGRFRDLILLDPNFRADGLRIARRDGAIVGAAYAVRRQVALVAGDLEPDRGWLLFFFVDPEACRQGIGQELLTSALTWLDRAEVEFAPYTPNYVLPGLDRAAYPVAAKLLDRQGFQTRYQAIAMEKDLGAYAMPKLKPREGWRIGTPSTDDLPELIALAGEHFNPDWARAIREALWRGLPLDRIVSARAPSGELAGWAMHGTYAGQPGRFGPFGVHSDQRGNGLGSILLHQTLQRMWADGHRTAWFLWTTEDSAAARLYTAAGFRITRRFDVMRCRFGV